MTFFQYTAGHFLTTEQFLPVHIPYIFQPHVKVSKYLWRHQVCQRFFYSTQALLLAINKWNIEFVIDWGEGFRVCNSDFLFSDAILWKCSKRKLLLLLSVWGRIYNHIMYKAGPLLLFKKHYTWPALQFSAQLFHLSVTHNPEINRCLGIIANYLSDDFW